MKDCFPVILGVKVKDLKLKHLNIEPTWYFGGEVVPDRVAYLFNKETKKFWITSHNCRVHREAITLGMESGPEVLDFMKRAYKDPLEVDITTTDSYKKLVAEGYTLATEAELPEFL
ncbi:MAG: hypothetical protein H7263_15665 [Candidatus Sericytochromatia bacterium]|nr:hypothetical protein [Candidatus Sericytochromatia bacterium]